MPSSSITVDRDRTHVVVRLSGEIDVSLRDQAGAALATVASAGLPVVLDLADALFVGATGLVFVVRCRRVCAEAGQPFVVRDVPLAVARVFAALGLQDALVRDPDDPGSSHTRDPQDAEPVA